MAERIIAHFLADAIDDNIQFLIDAIRCSQSTHKRTYRISVICHSRAMHHSADL
jgi:hypothetical protein